MYRLKSRLRKIEANKIFILYSSFFKFKFINFLRENNKSIKIVKNTNQTALKINCYLTIKIKFNYKLINMQ
jgi:hypothetical protein